MKHFKNWLSAKPCKTFRGRGDDNMADMAKREREEQKFRAELQRKGHTCVQTMESYPSQTAWCGQEVCSQKNRDLPHLQIAPDDDFFCRTRTRQYGKA